MKTQKESNRRSSRKSVSRQQRVNHGQDGQPPTDGPSREPTKSLGTLRDTLVACSERTGWTIPDGFEDRMLEEAQAGDWEGVFFYVQPPFRFTALEAVKEYLTGSQYWQAFRDIWSSCENSWEDLALIKSLVSDPRGNPHDMMTEAEREALSNLPDRIRIYRGATSHNKLGLGWTLEKARAEWFARRQATRSALCVSGECNKSDVLGLFLDRDEMEIFILPEHAEIQGIEPVLSDRAYPSRIQTKDWALRAMKTMKHLAEPGASPKKSKNAGAGLMHATATGSRAGLATGGAQ